jgi:hypothetical protein
MSSDPIHLLILERHYGKVSPRLCADAGQLQATPRQIPIGREHAKREVRAKSSQPLPEWLEDKPQPKTKSSRWGVAGCVTAVAAAVVIWLSVLGDKSRAPKPRIAQPISQSTPVVAPLVVDAVPVTPVLPPSVITEQSASTASQDAQNVGSDTPDSMPEPIPVAPPAPRVVQVQPRTVVAQSRRPSSKPAPTPSGQGHTNGPALVDWRTVGPHLVGTRLGSGEMVLAYDEKTRALVTDRRIIRAP